MVPSKFPQSNTVMTSPKSDDPNFECQDLHVYREGDENGQPGFISCWEPTKEELEDIVSTGKVWLKIYGYAHPPVWVGGHNPFINAKDITINEGAKDDVVVSVYLGKQYVFCRLPHGATNASVVKHDLERYRLEGDWDKDSYQFLFWEEVAIEGMANEVEGFNLIKTYLVKEHGFDLDRVVILSRPTIPAV